MVQRSSLVAICVCTAKEHVSSHLHALHFDLILTRGSGAGVGRDGASLWFAVFEWYKCQPLVRDHLVAKRRPCLQLVVTSSNTKRVIFRDYYEDRSASQDVKMNGMIGVSSLVQQLRHCLTTQECGERCAGTESRQAAARIFARQMHTLLIHLCGGRALAIVRGAPDHNGLEAWRLLHEWYLAEKEIKGFGVAE